MNFKTNFSKLTLIGNEVIKIYFDDKVIEFVPPNLRTYYSDLDFIEVYYVLRQTPDDFNKNVDNTNMFVETKYGILRFFLYTKFQIEKFEKFIHTLFPNLTILEDELVCGETPLTEQEYDILLDFIAVSCAEKDFKEFMKKIEIGLPDSVEKSEGKKELTEHEKKMKDIQDRLDAAKAKKKNKDSGQKTITIDQIVIAILYEFKSLNINDVYDMNVFTLLEFWGYIGKIIDNQIQIVAAGNGNLKDFTYFIN